MCRGAARRRRCGPGRRRRPDRADATQRGLAVVPSIYWALQEAISTGHSRDAIVAFVRMKGADRGLGYFYLVEARREGGRVRQVVLAYLGIDRTVEEAWWRAEDEIRRGFNWLR